MTFLYSIYTGNKHQGKKYKKVSIKRKKEGKKEKCRKKKSKRSEEKYFLLSPKIIESIDENPERKERKHKEKYMYVPYCDN